jgi:hypothetical protein
MIGWLTDDELGRMWNENVMARFKVLAPEFTPGGPEYNH